MFIPDRVFFQKEALGHELGKRLFHRFREQGAAVHVLDGSRPRSSGAQPGPRQQYLFAKRTLVVGVRKALSFQACKPSAHYQLPLVTSCPGLCEYCYLQTTLGPRPYVTVYVNVEEILSRARHYVEQRLPDLTLFEAGAAGDPLPVEPYTGALSRAITFFAGQQTGRLRVATKFDDVEPFLPLDHRGHTHFRFSVNATTIVDKFERGTPSLERRIQAARRLADRGYPVGFIVAPLFVFPGWEAEYEELARLIESRMYPLPHHRLTLELISHRFTARAKNTILARNPVSELPMSEQDRVIRRGQFGYLKYVYPPRVLAELKEEVTSVFRRHLPTATIEYFV